MDLSEISDGRCRLLPSGRDCGAKVTDIGVLLREVSSQDDTDETGALLPGPLGRAGLCCFSRTRRSSSAGSTRCLPYADLLGAVVHCSEESLVVHLIYCPKPGKAGASRIKEEVRLEVLVGEEARGQGAADDLRSQAESWAADVTSRSLSKAFASRHGPRHFLVFVNPASGAGTAQAAWDLARNLWDSMGSQFIEYDTVVTKCAGEAHDYVKERDILGYDGIIIVSGDGLVHEVFNGLARRPDATAALSIPIGHIPGGSGNGLATNVLKSCGESYGVIDAAFVIAKGEVQSISLVDVHQPARPPCVAFMTLSGAIISDIDIESEKLRWMGGARFTVWALFRLMRLRPLRAKIMYWPADVAVPPALPAPPLDEPLPVGPEAPWKVIDDEFSVFWGCNIPWASYDSCPAPAAQIHDSLWYLVILRRSASRKALLRCLLGFETGAHVDVPQLEMIPCRAFRLTPQEDSGFLSLDGEQVPVGPTQVWPSSLKGKLLGAPREDTSLV